MKKFAGLVVILAVLVLGGYYAMGLITENTLKKNLVKVNQTNGVFVDIAQYNRGWFTSDALINWRAHIPESVVTGADGQSQQVPAQDYQVQMPLKIYHGPVIFANHTVKFGMGYAHSDIAMPAQFNEKFNSLFTPESTHPMLDMSVFVNYLNSSQVNLSVPSFKLFAKQGNGQLAWQGMTSSTTVSSDQNKIKGNITLDGVKFSKDDIKTDMSAVSTDYNLHLTESGLYLGDASITFPSLVVMNKADKLLEVDEFDVHSSSDIENKLFNSHFKTTVDKVIVNNKVYGPGNLEMSLKNLDAEVLAHINQEVSHAQQGTTLEKQQAMIAMLPEVPKLFGRGAQFDISELSITLPQGTLEGNLTVALPASDNANPFEMMQKVVGSGKLKIPADVIKEILDKSNTQKIANQAVPTAASVAPPTTAESTSTTAVVIPAPDKTQQIAAMTNAQLNTMTESGLIVQQGTDYIIELKLAQGRLEVNGKPFNPNMIKF